MRCLCLLVVLAACVNKPVDVVAEIKIIPAKPGDDVELYFGTNPRQGHLSETAANQLAIDQVQAYAVDKIGPHIISNVPASLTLDISEPLPTLSIVIAFEEHATYAAAATIDLSDASAPSYVLQLQPVSQGVVAAEWGPSHPTADQAAKECAYYSGPGADGQPLTAAVVIDINTATTVTPYVDLDCDGFPAPSNPDVDTLECNDRDYDSTGQASDDSTCVAPYPAEGDCVVVGQACDDGIPTPGGCPGTITAQNVTKWCVPTGYCDGPNPAASLADMIAMPSSAAGAIECNVQIDPGSNGQPCVQMVSATGSPDLALCAGMQPIDVEIGAGGPPYAMDAIMPNTTDAKVSVSQLSDPCTIGFALDGDWSALAEPPVTTTLMLAITPDGSTRGLVVPVVFMTSAVQVGDTCNTAPPSTCVVSFPASTTDQSLTTCLSSP